MQRSGGYFFEIQYGFSFVCTHRLFLSLVFIACFLLTFFSFPLSLLFFSTFTTFYFLPSPSFLLPSLAI